MSVVVRGMEMPECCDVCIFSDWSNLSQTASCKLKEYEPCFDDFSNEYKSKRADFCPLVALPERRPSDNYIGEWIFHQDWKDDGECPYECNWCGRTFDYDMNYCGYCGAFMNRKAK